MHKVGLITLEKWYATMILTLSSSFRRAHTKKVNHNWSEKIRCAHLIQQQEQWNWNRDEDEMDGPNTYSDFNYLPSNNSLVNLKSEILILWNPWNIYIRASRIE